MSAELPGVDHVDEVVKELEKGIETIQDATKGSLKTSKVQYDEKTISKPRTLCFPNFPFACQLIYMYENILNDLARFHHSEKSGITENYVL